MNVIVFSYKFYPDYGGLETVSMVLAKGFVLNGLSCKVVTTTAAAGEEELPFEVIRNPSFKRKVELIKWADVILFNGASMGLQPLVFLLGKPFIWVHAGYQVSCIDGLGWVDGVRAPLTPFASIRFHARLKGLKWAIIQGGKLFLRRFFSKYLVTKNVAITRWVAQAQPLPRQVQIYNPFPLKEFMPVKPDPIPEYDFLYVGRLVSEKGVSTLLEAFRIVVKESNLTRLLIVGDGDWRGKLERLTEQLEIKDRVDFVGRKSGGELMKWVSKARIAVIPSEWNEPMGGVALEMLAAGKNIIVSESGGLKECAGDSALCFPNGDSNALAACMNQLLTDRELSELLLEKGKEQVKEFDPSLFISQYIDLLNEVVGPKS